MANRIAMIGGGNMATALVGGLIKNGFDPASIDVLDRNEHKRKMFADEMSVVVHDAPGEWLKDATVVVLAVKPQGLAQTCGCCSWTQERARNVQNRPKQRLCIRIWPFQYSLHCCLYSMSWMTI